MAVIDFILATGNFKPHGPAQTPLTFPIVHGRSGWAPPLPSRRPLAFYSGFRSKCTHYEFHKDPGSGRPLSDSGPTGAPLFSPCKQNIGAHQYPKRIVGDERDLDEYANEREQRD